MSNATTRLALAAALSTVNGINGFARRPTAPKPGDAWPQWRGSERGDGYSFVETWTVIIVLPADDMSADAFVDDHQSALSIALAPILYLDSYAPATLPVSGNDMYALMITGRTE